MLKPSETLLLGGAAQVILTADQPFTEVLPQIEKLAVRASSEWAASTLRKFPVAAALGHLIAYRLEEKEEVDIPLTSVLAVGTAHERYTVLTEPVDRLAAEEVVSELSTPESPHAIAFTYYAEQMDSCLRFFADNQDITARRGKSRPPPSVTGQNSLVEHLVASSRLTIPSLIVRETVHLCLDRGGLPASEELADHFRSNVTSFTDLSRLPGQVFINNQIGKELARLRIEQLRKHHSSDLASFNWLEVLNQVASTGAVSSLAQALVAGLKTAGDPVCRMTGYCPAQLYFKSHEPYGNDAHKNLMTNYFAQHGIAITDGVFRTADHQLLRCVDALETTFFADSDYRGAFEAMADAGRA